jgi:hypothetical protein
MAPRRGQKCPFSGVKGPVRENVMLAGVSPHYLNY